MRRTIRNLIILIALSVAIKIFSLFPHAVEKYYSTGIYVYISKFQRWLLGWIPFSVGDLIYAAAAIYIIYNIIAFTRHLYKKQVGKHYLIYLFLKLVTTAVFIYVVFNILWGLNYNRVGIASQLQMKVDKYETQELRNLIQVLVNRLNTTYPSSRFSLDDLKKKRTLFKGSANAYRLAAVEYPQLTYKPFSVKPSLYSYLGNYLGFTGYYNPFSGEAQVNTTVPVYVQPFTTCHELGHQLGYAKENEANFAGVLSAKSSTDSAFRYALYFDLYSYAIRDLYRRDTSQVTFFRNQLLPGVRADYSNLRTFYQRYTNPFEPYIRKAYANYLKANEQPMGMMSYNEVVAMVIAYIRKNGNDSI